MGKRTRYGWFELISGILLIVLGIVTLVRPKSAITGFVMIYGLLAVVTGISDIVFYVKREQYMGFGPTISLVSGILSVMTGLILLAHPGAGRWALAVLFPLWFIAHCIAQLSHLTLVRITAGKAYYYFSLTINILGLVLSLLMLVRPDVSFMTLSFLIGMYLILLGTDSVAAGIGKMGRDW